MPRWRKLEPSDVDEAIATGLVILDFAQESCPPCHALEPRLETFAARHGDEVDIHQVDVDENEETPRVFGVMSIPTLIVFRDALEVERLDGPDPRRRPRAGTRTVAG